MHRIIFGCVENYAFRDVAMNKVFDAKYFYDKLAKIPEELWCMGRFQDGEKHCALGFCAKGIEGSSLQEILHVVAINDNHEGRFTYLGNTPKQRILNALQLVCEMPL